MQRDKDPICRTELTQEGGSTAVWGHVCIHGLFNSGVRVRVSVTDLDKTKRYGKACGGPEVMAWP